MNKTLYSVSLKDQYGNEEAQFFDKDRESAINYFKTKSALLSQSLKDWNKEVGINYCVWRKGEEFRELSVVMTEAD